MNRFVEHSFIELQRTIATVPDVTKFPTFRQAIGDIVQRAIREDEDRAAVADRFVDIALTHGFFGIGEDAIDSLIAEGFMQTEFERDEDETDLERLYREADAKHARANGKDPPPAPLDEWSAADDIKPPPPRRRTSKKDTPIVLE